MTIVMLTLYRLLPRDEQEPVPPREITENLVHGLDLDVSGAEPVLTAMTIVGHFSYGAFCGLLYAAATRRTRERYLSLGMLFGLVVWIVSYVAWLPAVGIFRTATQQAPRRNAAMVLAHVIWGLALGVTFRRLDAAKASTRGTASERALP